MKLTKKRIGIAALGAVCALTAVAGASLLRGKGSGSALADTDKGAPSSVYYYDNLVDAEGKEYTLAKKFYDALDKLNKDGEFKDGTVSYDITSIATSAGIKAWVKDGDLTVPKAFSAARDSYYYDHPELFYIDIYKITLSAGFDGEGYVGYMDSGREANLYADGGFTSEAEVNKAISNYNAKIDAVVEYAQTEAEKDQYDIAKEVLLARYANQYIAANTKYDDDSAADSTVTTGSVSQTAYGALVANTAVCNGYSRAFKAVMDKLEIPCIVVGGYSVTKNSQGASVTTGEGHAWNYVWYLDPVIKEEIDEDEAQVATYADGKSGSWYSYDVTWNSTAEHSNLLYCDMGALSDGRYHSADGEVSTSGYILNYPELSTFNYGCATATNGLSRVGKYSAVDDGNTPYDDYGNPRKQLIEYISYNGKGADKLLEEDGLHIIYRYQGYENGEDGQLTWTQWASVTNSYIAIYGEPGDKNPYQSEVLCFYDSLYSQFAVTDLEPDGPEENPIIKYYYGDEELLAEHIIDITGLYENKTYNTYLAAPHVASTTPNCRETQQIKDSMAKPGTSMMDEKYAFTLSVTYNEPLQKLVKNQPIGVTYTTRVPHSNLSEYAKFLPVNEAGDFAEISDDGKTLTFKFMPSLMFEHNNMLYSFQFTNVGSAKTMYDKNGEPYTTDKLPNSAPFVFSRSVMFCPNILGGGRLWVDCCALPTLVSDSNLAEMEFEDENGSTFTSNMSQMMLVVESVSDEVEGEMLNGIKDVENSNVTRDDILEKATYDIDLMHCGRYATIPDNSHVKISLGFPEGFGPDKEGVTYKIYHRKHLEDGTYIIEEIPCVVTKLGIVATVNSFSPYMVAAFDSEKVTSSGKTVYATIDGKGGTLSMEDSEIRVLEEGGEYTYTIQPDKGYMIYTVTINDKDITDKVVDGKLTVTYADLDATNEIEIKYIANAAAKRYVENNVVEPVKVVVDTDGKVNAVEGTGGKVELDISGIDIPDDNDDNDDNNDNKGPEAGINPAPGTDAPDGNSDNTAIIIVGVAIAVVVVLLVVAVIIVRKRRAAYDDDYDD